MNKLTISLCVLLLATMVAPAFAVEGDGGWLTDMDAARKLSAEKNLPILTLFTGSDWCIWCKRLEGEILSQDDFKSYASASLVLLKLDFPRKGEVSPEVKEKRRALAQEYQIQGFPTIVLLDAQGRELARTGYEKMTPAEYVEHLKKLLKH